MRRSSCTSCMPACAIAWLLLAGDVGAVEHDRAGARRHHAHQALQRRALAGAVAAEQRHHLVAPRRAARRRTGCASRRSSCCRPLTSSRLMPPARHARRRDRLPAPAGVALDLLRRAFDQHAALLQHGDALGQLEQRIHVVVDDDHGAALADRLQQLDGLDPLARAHAGQRLVEQQQARRGRQREPDLQPPLLAVGELRHRRVGAPRRGSPARACARPARASPGMLRQAAQHVERGTCRAARRARRCVRFSRTVRRLNSWLTW